MKMQEMEIVATESEMRRFKKTRRGKKRRLKPFIEENASECDIHQQFSEPEENAEESMSTNYVPLRNLDPLALEAVNDPTVDSIALSTSYCSGSNQSLILRPLQVPKAPSNSTQFIMDDHENCNLYVSFESPSRYKRRRRSTGTSSGDAASGDYCTSPCMGYRDIDYEYESPDDLDTTSFFERDFEIIYRRAREEELITLSRSELISQFIELEGKANSYEQLLNGDMPSVASLQEELLKLQEENALLRKTNLYLKGNTSISDDDYDDEEDEIATSYNSSSTEFTSNINTTSTTAATTDSSDDAESEVCDVSVENKEDKETKIEMSSNRKDLAVNVT